MFARLRWSEAPNKLQLRTHSKPTLLIDADEPSIPEAVEACLQQEEIAEKIGTLKSPRPYVGSILAEESR